MIVGNTELTQAFPSKPSSEIGTVVLSLASCPDVSLKELFVGIFVDTADAECLPAVI